MVFVEIGLCLINRELMYLTDPTEKYLIPKFCVIGRKTDFLVHFKSSVLWKYW